MKKILLSFISLLTALDCLAQANSWTRSDRDNLYNDCLSYLSSNYKHLTNEQKETMSLCFLDQVSTKYGKDSYQAKIEVELKRLRSAVTEECAKTHGIELTPPKEVKIDTPKVVVEWTKQDKDNYFKSCSTYLNANFKNLNRDQKESICICFFEQLTSKNVKADFIAKTDIEQKRLKNNSIDECANNNGIDLKAKPASDKPNNDNIKGHWKDKKENEDFWLNDGGNFTMNTNGRRSNGTWKLYGDKLTLYFDKLFGTKQRDYEILMFSEDKFVYQSVKNRSTFTVEKIK